MCSSCRKMVIQIQVKSSTRVYLAFLNVCLYGTVKDTNITIIITTITHHHFIIITIISSPFSSIIIIITTITIIFPPFSSPSSYHCTHRGNIGLWSWWANNGLALFGHRLILGGLDQICGVLCKVGKGLVCLYVCVCVCVCVHVS